MGTNTDRFADFAPNFPAREKYGLGPRKIGKYPIEFKAKAVALSRLPGLEVRQVAESWGIHPFLLSRWRKEARNGLWVVNSGKLGLDAQQVAELKRLRKVEQENRVLKEELTRLKQAIRFCSERKQRSTPLWNRTGSNTE